MSIKISKKVCVFKACITYTIINQRCNIISFLFEYLIQKIKYLTIFCILRTSIIDQRMNLKKPTKSALSAAVKAVFFKWAKLNIS